VELGIMADVADVNPKQNHKAERRCCGDSPWKQRFRKWHLCWTWGESFMIICPDSQAWSLKPMACHTGDY
jgi:hypothetical protein